MTDKRLLDSVDASRPCPGGDELKAAFRITVKRTLRRSDATVSVEGIRYQVPAPWRHLSTLWIRYARWDLSSVDLVDGRGGERLCTLYPLDRRGNAGGVRCPVGVGRELRQRCARERWSLTERAYPSEPGLTTCWVCGCHRRNVRLMFRHAQPLEVRPPDVPRRLRGALSR